LRWLNAQDGKETCGYLFAKDSLRRSAFGEIFSNLVDAGHSAENVILPGVILKVGGSDCHSIRLSRGWASPYISAGRAPVCGRLASQFLPQGYEPVRLRVRQWTEHDAFHYAENRAIHSDPQGQDQNRDSSETGALPQGAEGVAEVLEEGLNRRHIPILDTQPGKRLGCCMLPPDQDEDDRRPIWDMLQMFWMDTDPSDWLRSSAEVCAHSKYSLSEIEAIFWNEVRPAVGFNLYSGVAPEWAGFEIGWLSKRILQKNRFGRRLPFKFSIHTRMAGGRNCVSKLNERGGSSRPANRPP
jgi:hypothetical protein